MKLALSLNGKIATKSSESNWISGEDARTLVHFFRSRYDAVMVGTKTALTDNPNLNLRGQFAYLPSPQKIIIDRELALPKTSNFVKNSTLGNLIMVHDQQIDPTILRKWRQNGIKTLGVRTDKRNHLDLTDLFIKLADLGLTSVLVEGGGTLATALLEQDLVDLLILFTAGLIIDKQGINGLNLTMPTNTTLSNMPRFSLEKTYRIGDDVAHFWRPLTQ